MEFKESDFILSEYSGKIYPHECGMNFLDCKLRLEKVLATPFALQEFLESNILIKNPDNRT